MPNLPTSGLPPAPSIDPAGYIELSQDVGSGLTSYKMTVTQLSSAIVPATTVTFVSQSSTGGPVTYSLPTASSAADKLYIVKDTGGSANVNNITVNVTGGGNIDNVTSIPITAAYGAGRFYSNSTQWWSV
jgi:hypothetical protein